MRKFVTIYTHSTICLQHLNNYQPVRCRLSRRRVELAPRQRQRPRNCAGARARRQRDATCATGSSIRARTPRRERSASRPGAADPCACRMGASGSSARPCAQRTKVPATARLRSRLARGSQPSRHNQQSARTAMCVAAPHHSVRAAQSPPPSIASHIHSPVCSSLCLSRSLFAPLSSHTT